MTFVSIDLAVSNNNYVGVVDGFDAAGRVTFAREASCGNCSKMGGMHGPIAETCDVIGVTRSFSIGVDCLMTLVIHF